MLTVELCLVFRLLEILFCKAENVTLQRAPRQFRVFYTHTNARQTSDGVCRPLFYLHMRASSTLD